MGQAPSPPGGESPNKLLPPRSNEYLARKVVLDQNIFVTKERKTKRTSDLRRQNNRELKLIATAGQIRTAR
jgi:hypothetical protein